MRAIHLRYEFNVALNADVSLASIRIISCLGWALDMWTRALDVAGFLVSGCMAFRTISDNSLEGRSRVIVACLFIVHDSRLGGRL